MNYSKIANNPILVPTLQCSLILPALIYTFENLRNSEIDEFSSYKWFISMDKTFEKNGSPLTKDLLENKSSFELAQAVLGSPIKRAFEQIVNMDFEEEDE